MDLENKIKNVVAKFLEISKDKETIIISHFDTDGITSASIIIKALKKLDKGFSVKILKSLEKEFIKTLPRNKIILFLDLASNALDEISELNLQNVFIIDHHEIVQTQNEKINIINPQLHDKQKISSAGLAYLFAREIDESNKNLAKLAVLGMIGDRLEDDIEKLNHEILKDSEVKKKRGLLIYPSTRPLNRALEFSSNPYIPGVTGDAKGVLELLREIELKPVNSKYPALIELNEYEMTKLVTAITLRMSNVNTKIIGDIFLIKLYNKLEDARELSATVNACSRLGRSDIAIQFCMEITNAKAQAEELYIKYRQHIVSGLKFAVETEKLNDNGLTIINAGDKIKDTMIGTITSILSSSSLYEPGTIIIGMANQEIEKIKISARNVGKVGKNVREILANVVDKIGGEVGGHEFAAGGIISKEKENDFINQLRKSMEIEVVKI